MKTPQVAAIPGMTPLGIKPSITFQPVSSSSASGTHLQGTVTTRYQRLVEVFGPSRGPGDKVTQEWIIQFSDGVVATIYDWKEPSTPTEEYEWHVGGFNSQALHNVMTVLNRSLTLS